MGLVIGLNIPAFIATPVGQSIGRSVADDEAARPKSNVSAKIS